jgi:hypothetical protein
MFLGRRVPASFVAEAMLIAPYSEHTYDDAAWQNAIVVIELGEVDLEWHTGRRLRCVPGDVLYLGGLHLRALINPGPEPAILIAVTRKRPPAPRQPISQ